MQLDDEICLCFHVTQRKLLSFIRVQQPRRASQLSECFGAGTGCGWCRPFLRQLFADTAGASPVSGVPARAGRVRPAAGGIYSGRQRNASPGERAWHLIRCAGSTTNWRRSRRPACAGGGWCGRVRQALRSALLLLEELLELARRDVDLLDHVALAQHLQREFLADVVAVGRRTRCPAGRAPRAAARAGCRCAARRRRARRSAVRR